MTLEQQADATPAAVILPQAEYDAQLRVEAAARQLTSRCPFCIDPAPDGHPNHVELGTALAELARVREAGA